jgi:acetyl-CoA carboxylase carboxyl transferase subunit beta
MSWLEKLLPPKIQHTDPADRRQVPEGLWIKCPSCETVLYKTDLEENQNVCPSCSHHLRICLLYTSDATDEQCMV